MKPGDIVINHCDGGKKNQRIIHIDQVTDRVWIGSLAFATTQGRERTAYCPQPKVYSLKLVDENVSTGQWSCVGFESPSEWSWTDEDFAAKDTSILRRQRRQRSKWKIRRDKTYELIAPLVERATVAEILTQELHLSWPKQRAVELGLKSSRDVYTSLHKYLVGLGNKNALVPAYGKCGGVGQQKFFECPPGQPIEGAGKLFNSDEKSRTQMGLGWKKYKKKGVSVRIAYDKFLNEFYVSEVAWVDHRMVAKLLPEGNYPSLDQFMEWGPRHSDNMKAKAINAGETQHRNSANLRAGRSRTSVMAVGVLGQIDSTPCDQNLVSESSRLKVLSTPYKAELVDSQIGYIFGIHVGFEHPSTTTNLLAILNGASSKVEFCARYGVKIREDQWLTMGFRRILADNGEMKSQAGMASIEEMESSIEFCESYFGERKAVEESSNRRGHVHNDHLIPGSNMGRQTQRGEKTPALNACFTFHEYMPRLIESILYRNNEEIIPYPLVEMRKDGVQPVRIDMIRWFIDKGYCASEPTDLDALKVRCLPRLQAVMHADGVHLFDPTCQRERLIPSLRYSSQWLQQSGAMKRAHLSAKRLEAHVNPSNLREIWINLDGLRPLQIMTNDPYLQQLTLHDWLFISWDDNLIGMLSKHADREYHVSRIATIDTVTSDAKREKKQELDELDKRPSKSSLIKGKRKNTFDEMLAMGQFPKNSSTQPAIENINSPTLTQTITSGRVCNPIQEMLRRQRKGRLS